MWRGCGQRQPSARGGMRRGQPRGSRVPAAARRSTRCAPPSCSAGCGTTRSTRPPGCRSSRACLPRRSACLQTGGGAERVSSVRAVSETRPSRSRLAVVHHRHHERLRRSVLGVFEGIEENAQPFVSVVVAVDRPRPPLLRRVPVAHADGESSLQGTHGARIRRLAARRLTKRPSRRRRRAAPRRRCASRAAPPTSRAPPARPPRPSPPCSASPASA